MKSDSATALPRRPSPGAAGARLAALYEEHARMVYGICRLMLRDSDEAEDAAQQVFLSAYRSLLAGTEPRSAGAWLGTIARNEARGRIAARTLRPVALDRQLEPTSTTLEEQAGARAELADLRDELSALPEKQREAVVLRDLYGLRYDEVARALNTSRPAVEALLFRGRRQIQRRLRPGLAAGVLVVPLALRESLAYAVPGFAGGASTAGLLTKLAAVPIAAKVAAVGATVGVAGSAGLVAERELRDPPARPLSALVEPASTAKQDALSTGSPLVKRQEEARDEDGEGGDPRRELEDVRSHGSDDADAEADDDDRDEPEEAKDVESADSDGKDESRPEHAKDAETDHGSRAVSRIGDDNGEPEQAKEPEALEALEDADLPDDPHEADEAE